jgi:hypothetical protein
MRGETTEPTAGRTPAAWAEGRALSLEDAVAYALDETREG